jgi:uncharacterized protein YwqG
LDTLASFASVGLAAALTGCLFAIWPARGGQPLARRHLWTDQNITPEELRARLRQMSRPALLLTPTNQPRFSKIGGTPDLAGGMRWPLGVEGPRAFLMQIDLAEVRRAGGPDWLPWSGALHAFLDPAEHRSGNAVRIRFTTEPDLRPRPFPQDLPKEQRFLERRLAMTPVASTPSCAWLDIAPGAALRQSPKDVLAAPASATPDHRLGGYPVEILPHQLALDCEHLSRGLEGSAHDGEPSDDLRRAAEDWRLLLQIDTDRDLRLEYGDRGRFYVFIREEDARRGRFSQTVTISQSY